MSVVAEHSKLERSLLQLTDVIVVLKLKDDKVVTVYKSIHSLQQIEELRLEVSFVCAVYCFV